MLNSVSADRPRLPQRPGSDVVEQLVPHDGVDVHHDAHQHDHVPNAGNGPHQRRHDEPQVSHRRNQPHHPQQPGQAGDHRELPRRWQQREYDHQEVEGIPTVAEIPPGPWPTRQQLQRRFSDEYPQRRIVAQPQQVAVIAVDGCGSLQTQQNAVEYDDGNDGVFKPGGIDQASGEIYKVAHVERRSGCKILGGGMRDDTRWFDDPAFPQRHYIPITTTRLNPSGARIVGLPSRALFPHCRRDAKGGGGKPNS